MSLPDINQMLDAGVHFGHLTKRWNPKMKKFILTERNGIYILDLAKTHECLSVAVEAIKRIRSGGKPILFVGTKKTIKDCVREEAERCGQYSVTERWLGGMLTNFSTVRKSIKRLEDIEKMETDGVFAQITKKEVLGLNRERAKLESVFSGIRNMRTLPGCLFVVDSKTEEIAIHEARRLKIPVIAIVDTNSDPDQINYPIPGNDDSLKSVSLISRVLSDAISTTPTSLVIVEEKVAPIVSEAAMAAAAAKEAEDNA